MDPIFIVVWLLFGLVTGVIASSKNRSVGLWAVLGILFGFIALAVVAFMPKRPALG